MHVTVISWLVNARETREEWVTAAVPQCLDGDRLCLPGFG